MDFLWHTTLRLSHSFVYVFRSKITYIQQQHRPDYHISNNKKITKLQQEKKQNRQNNAKKTEVQKIYIKNRFVRGEKREVNNGKLLPSVTRCSMCVRPTGEETDGVAVVAIAVVVDAVGVVEVVFVVVVVAGAAAANAVAGVDESACLPFFVRRFAAVPKAKDMRFKKKGGRV